MLWFMGPQRVGHDWVTEMNWTELRRSKHPLQYSCLENPVDGGAWWAAVHRVTQSQTQLKQLSVHACIGEGNGSPLQCSCQENHRVSGTWWAAVYGVKQSRTWLKRLSSSSRWLVQPWITEFSSFSWKTQGWVIYLKMLSVISVCSLTPQRV